MKIDLTKEIFEKMKDAVVTGIFLNYFDQDIRGVPGVVLFLIKNSEQFRLEVWNANRIICNIDTSTQKWVKDVLYEEDGKFRIRVYTIFQVMEYEGMAYSEIVFVGKSIELKLIDFKEVK